MAEWWLAMRGPIHNVTWSFNHVALWGHVINQICYISTSTRLLNIKHGMVVIYCEGPSHIKSRNPLNTWSWDHLNICSRPMANKLDKVVVECHRLVWEDSTANPNFSSRNKNGYTRKQLTDFSITPLEPKLQIFFLTSPNHKFGTPKKMTPKYQAKLKPSFP